MRRPVDPDSANPTAAPMAKSLQSKIRQARLNAPLEVPKARLCSRVIIAMAMGHPLDGPVQALKSGLGSNWSPVLAVQFMSGRRGQMAAQSAPDVERESLYLAHLVAKEIADRQPVTRARLAALRQLALEIFGSSAPGNHP